MPYQPSNQTGKEPLGTLAFVAGGAYWYVDDIDYKANPTAYGSSDTPLRILPNRGKFILCNDRGMYVKWPARRGEYKGRTRYFKTAILAAEHALENR